MTTWHEVSARAGRNDMPMILVQAALLDRTMTDPAEIAKGIKAAWTECEWPGLAFNDAETSRDIWHNLFGMACDTGEYLDETTPTDVTTLPETLTLYRGCSDGHESGMSWTTSFDRAHWFATRLSALWGGGKVYKAQVPRELIMAHFHEGRGEFEYVVDTSDLWEDEFELVPEDAYSALLDEEKMEKA